MTKEERAAKRILWEQRGDGNAFLIAEYCTFFCRFMYFYFTENTCTPLSVCEFLPYQHRCLYKKPYLNRYLRLVPYPIFSL